MENGIELRGVTRRFGRKTALEDVTLRMEGGVFALLGPAGAGKSTLLRVLSTLLRADAGEARVCGVPLKKAGAVRAITGYLPEEFNIYGDMRVREAMDYLGALSGLDAPTCRARTGQLLELAGLEKQADARVRRLSRGMLRRLGLAQALIHDPRVLLADEPLRDLEVDDRVRVRALLAEAAVDRLVVVAARAARDVEDLCARVAVLENGRLRAQGAAKEMIRRAQGRVFLAELPESALEDFRRRFRVASVVEHGERCVARFVAPDGAPGLGRADAPCLADACLLCLEGGWTR